MADPLRAVKAATVARAAGVTPGVGQSDRPQPERGGVMSATRTATCPACRRPVAVKKDGTLRHHRPHLGSGPDYYRCVGSDALPLEDRNDPRGDAEADR